MDRARVMLARCWGVVGDSEISKAVVPTRTPNLAEFGRVYFSVVGPANSREFRGTADRMSVMWCGSSQGGPNGREGSGDAS